MPHVLFSCNGGNIVLPKTPLIDRQDGGNLWILPARTVWDRTELPADELISWSALVSTTAQAMLESLPQLEGGCINYWDAGNWALNEQVKPFGPKTGPKYRKLHLHLIGRSPLATDPAWRWGEAPKFPDYLESINNPSDYNNLLADECHNIIKKTEININEKFSTQITEISPWRNCDRCTYPTPISTISPTTCTRCIEKV